MIRILIVFIFSDFCLSCANSYEKKMVGEYRAYEYIPDTMQLKGVVSLILDKDNTFLYILKEDSVHGNWEAGDNGDMTWIRFHFRNGRTSEGQVGGGNLDLISIWNPQDFMLPRLKKVKFNRVK